MTTAPAPLRPLRRAAAALALGALVAIAALVPADRPLPVDLCVLHRLTGLDCMTCGLSRALGLLVRGDWEASLRMHPAGAPVLAALIVAAAWMSAEALRGQAVAGRLPRRLVALLAGSAALIAALWSVARLAG